MTMIITVDTNIFNQNDYGRLLDAIGEQDIAIQKITVTDRELQSRANGEDEDLGSAAFPEVFILNESMLNGAVLGDIASEELFEDILRITTSGNFPKKGKRSELSDNERRRLRDAMIIEAHVRSEADVLVTNDKKSIGKTNGSTLRTALQDLCGTNFMTLQEFVDYCVEVRL